MPDAPLRPCSYPGCAELVERGRCEYHKRPSHAHGKTADRGYDGRWEKFRAWFLRRHPVCCGSAEIPENWMAVEHELQGLCGRPARPVHHIRKVADFPELRLVESNCFPQCDACHAVRTARGE